MHGGATGPVGPVSTGPLFEEIIGGAELPFIVSLRLPLTSMHITGALNIQVVVISNDFISAKDFVY